MHEILENFKALRLQAKPNVDHIIAMCGENWPAQKELLLKRIDIFKKLNMCMHKIQAICEMTIKTDSETEVYMLLGCIDDNDYIEFDLLLQKTEENIQNANGK